MSDKPKRQVQRAIGPRLRIVFHIVLGLLAIIGANSLYLGGVTFLSWWNSKTYQDYFYNWMFLLHVVLGLIIIVPFLIFGFLHWRNTKDRKIRRTVMIGYALPCTGLMWPGRLLVAGSTGCIDLWGLAFAGRRDLSGEALLQPQPWGWWPGSPPIRGHGT
jgi:hypothetical protein